MTMGGFENEVPASKFSRFLAILWIITSLFFISFLTAQITSSLTVAELNSDISSYKDLSDKKVGLMNSQPVIDFVKKKIDAKVVVFDNYNDFYQALRDEKVDTLIGDSPIINYYVANNKDGKDFKVVGKIFKPEKYGILFSEKSSLKEEIDRGIIKLQESGEYQKIYNKYFK
jgi:polar amino acid transport system substrate-binding protein